MSTMTSAEFIKQVRPDIFTARWGTNEDKLIIRSSPTMGILIGTAVGSILWVGIIFALSTFFF